jgi:hypothetical protein
MFSKKKDSEELKPNKINFSEFKTLVKKSNGIHNESLFMGYTPEIIKSYIFENSRLFDGSDLTTQANILNVMLVINPKIIFEIAYFEDFYKFLPLIFQNVKCNILNDKGQNFLFNLRNLQNVLTVLESGLNFDVNFVDNESATFITVFMSNYICGSDECFQLINLLIKKRYDFSNHNDNGAGFFHISRYYNGYDASFIMRIRYDTLIKCINNSIGIELCLEFYQQLVFYFNKYNFSYDPDYDLTFNIVFGGVTYKKNNQAILCKIIKFYKNKNAENDIIELTMNFHNLGKLKEILEYVDENGNTVIHLAAELHYKKLLYLLLDSVKNLVIKSNFNGKYPAQLYSESKLTNKLKQLEPMAPVSLLIN